MDEMTREQMIDALKSVFDYIECIYDVGFETALGNLRSVMTALESEEVVAEGYTTQDAEVCMKRYGQFTVWAKRIDKVNRRVRIVVAKEGE